MPPATGIRMLVSSERCCFGTPLEVAPVAPPFR